METIQLTIDHQTLEVAKQLANATGCTLNELFVALVKEQPQCAGCDDCSIGFMSDAPELMDEIMADVYKSRETMRLRAAE
jgi:hypothetical protein